MRSLLPLGIGIVIGLAIHATAQVPIRTERVVNQASVSSPNQGIVGLNHVAINVPNLEEAYEYYTKKMGFTEVYRINENGTFVMAYLQISRSTFLEIIRADPQRQRPVGFSHFGVQVDDVGAASAMFADRGVTVPQPANPTSPIRMITDPFGYRTELVRVGPDSPLYDAANRGQGR